ncbi:MAG: methylated-DNA--[protein]-cysteine S-methyltransferase [Tissierellales bacterium]|nr:methylated-DNA--[protein]-cysteine S-methyltransferase [Tissierellales bacterium]
MHRYAYSFESKIGKINIYQIENKIVRIEYNEDMIANSYEMEVTPLIKKTVNELEEYFNGDRKMFTIPIGLSGTEFQIKVWNELLKIPFGETKTYREIAKSIGNDKAYRAVGGANNKNPIPIIVPCHRVVGADKSLVGYKGGLDIKKALLEIEKIY